MSRYPAAEWVPWRYISDSGQPAYFKGVNRPEAVVLHVMQGYMSTARQWAIVGHYGASWHFSVGRDGSVMQHLDFEDGGYHAGIPDTAPSPVWPLWKGHGVNVNLYTIGIEHEGFSGDGFTEAQRLASRDLCKWLAGELGFPYDRDHFPPHADIDLVNRPSDFAPPDGREAHYQYMFEEESMSEADRLRLDRLEKLLAGNGIAKDLSKPDELTFGEDALAYAAERGWSAFLGLGLNQTATANHKHPSPEEEPRVRTIPIGTKFQAEVTE